MNRFKAFTLVELLVSIGVIVLLISLILPSLSASRKSARIAVCLSNLQQLATDVSAYASEHRDNIVSFSWHRTMQPPADIPADVLAVFNNGVSQERDVNIHAAQLVYELRKSMGMDELTAPAFGGSLVHSSYGLIVMDLWAGRSPLLTGIRVCPEDTKRRAWVDEQRFESDIDGVRDGANQVNPPSRWLYRYQSSYRMTNSAFSPDADVRVVIPAQSHYSAPLAISSTIPLGRRKHSEVVFPSQKVLLFDQQDRHSSKRQMWYAERMAKQPLLMFDGSASMRATADANPGWHPHFPQAMPPPGTDKFSNAIFQYVLRVNYRPQRVLGEAPALKTPEPVYPPFYWFTRGGLKGVDFSSNDVDTSNWVMQ